VARSLAYHTRFLTEVSHSSPQIEVVWDLAEVRRSLEFIAAHGLEADNEAVRAVGRIFARTQNTEVRRFCLDSLSRINSERARTELTRISENRAVDSSWRELSSDYLTKISGKTAQAAPARNEGQKSGQ